MRGSLLRVLPRIHTFERTADGPVPAKVLADADIPCTISGKITEIAVREAIHGRPVTNTEALANPEALELYRDLEELKA